MKIIQGSLESSEKSIAIVVSRTNKMINNNLLEGSLDTLKRIGKVRDENIHIFWIPGAYEIPLTLKCLVNIKKYHAIIALATIIKGSTYHYKFLTQSCINEILRISSNSLLPISYGILTTENIDQAIERSGIKLNNKGSEAAVAALEMINIIHRISKIYK